MKKGLCSTHICVRVACFYRSFVLYGKPSPVIFVRPLRLCKKLVYRGTGFDVVEVRICDVSPRYLDTFIELGSINAAISIEFFPRFCWCLARRSPEMLVPLNLCDFVFLSCRGWVPTDDLVVLWSGVLPASQCEMRVLSADNCTN